MRKKKIKLKNKERTACEIWTRVMGYYRPTKFFNKGKQSEYKDRKCFRQPEETKKEDSSEGQEKD